MDSHGFYGWGVPSVPSAAHKIRPLPPPALIIQDEHVGVTAPGRGAKRVSAHVATCLLAAAQHH